MSISSELQEISLEFKQWLESEQGLSLKKAIVSENEEVNQIFKQISSMDIHSSQFNEYVLYGLLPHSKSKYARRISIYAAFRNIKKLFDLKYKYNDNDWNTISNKIFTLLSKITTEPDKLDDHIQVFISDKYSRGFQTGAISPLFFCLNNGFPIINNRVVNTFNEISSLLKLNDKIDSKLENYILNIEKIKKLNEKLNSIIKDNATFDLFCYWYDKFFDKTDVEEEDLQEYSLSENLKIENINFKDYMSTLHLEDLIHNTPRSLKRPDMIDINEIIRNSVKGRWVIPNFQRYFDWKKNNVKEFLESIFNDYYVGSLLLWELDAEPPLDIIPIKGIDLDPEESKRIDFMILDGQQRITSLIYVVISPNYSLKGSREKLFFYINFGNYFKQTQGLELIEILPKKLSNEETYERMLFPLYELLNYKKWLFDFETFLYEESTNDRDKIRHMANIIRTKLDHLLNGFSIPYVTLPETMSLDEVTQIFERINTMGKLLNVFDLLIARLYKYDIDLRNLWDETIRQYPKFRNYFRQYEKFPIYILQAISLVYHKTSSSKREDILNIYKNIFEVSELSFEDKWREMSAYIYKAILKLENMRDGFGVKNEKEIPFFSIIPVLAALLREIDQRKNQQAECHKRMSMWYWSAIFTNAYSGAVETQMTFDFKEVKEWFQVDKIPQTVRRCRKEMSSIDLTDFHVRSGAIYKGILSIFALSGSKDFVKNETLENSLNSDKDHIFPIKEFADNKFINSVLNICWMSDNSNRKIKRFKRPSSYCNNFFQERFNNNNEMFIEMLESHLINRKAYEYMLKDDLTGFIYEREKTVKAKINGLIGQQDEFSSETMIRPEKPFLNRILIQETIDKCDEYIYWVDKYFSPEGLRHLYKSLNHREKNTIKEIKILTSLIKTDTELRNSFKEFKNDLQSNGINCELRVISDRKLYSSIHDRWIISKDKCFNLPSVDVVKRGQYSEIKETYNIPPFNEWWINSLDIILDWNKISPLIQYEQDKTKNFRYK